MSTLSFTGTIAWIKGGDGGVYLAHNASGVASAAPTGFVMADMDGDGDADVVLSLPGPTVLVAWRANAAAANLVNSALVFAPAVPLNPLPLPGVSFVASLTPWPGAGAVVAGDDGASATWTVWFLPATGTPVQASGVRVCV